MSELHTIPGTPPWRSCIQDGISIQPVFFLTLACAVAVSGCSANMVSDQTFVVRDPEIGTKAVYRIELRTRGEGAVKYDFSARFLPVSSIEIYDGKVPEAITSASTRLLTSTGSAQSAQIETDFADLLVAMGKLQSEKWKAKVGEGQFSHAVRGATEDFGSLVDAATLSREDLRSVGRTGSAHPSRRSKLVYAVSTTPVKLQSFDSELRQLGGTLDAVSAAIAGPRMQAVLTARLEAEVLRDRVADLAKQLAQVDDLEGRLAALALEKQKLEAQVAKVTADGAASKKTLDDQIKKLGEDAAATKTLIEGKLAKLGADATVEKKDLENQLTKLATDTEAETKKVKDQTAKVDTDTAAEKKRLDEQLAKLTAESASNKIALEAQLVDRMRTLVEAVGTALELAKAPTTDGTAKIGATAAGGGL